MTLIQDLLSLGVQPSVALEASVTEGYDESSQFDADYDKVRELLAEVSAIVSSPDWKDHLKATDKNFDTSAVELNRRAIDKLDMTVDAFKAMYDHIVERAQ
jgi:hypothetical protein